MPKVRFTQTRVVQDARTGTPDEERYEAGQVYDLAPASAARWIARNVAVAVDDAAAPAADEVPPAAPAADAPPKARRRKSKIIEGDADDAAGGEA